MAPRNRSIELSEPEIHRLSKKLIRLSAPAQPKDVVNKIICQDMLKASAFLPAGFVDVLFLDPPYNLNKSFNGTAFKRKHINEYSAILDEWIKSLLHTLKPTASIYICGDWHSSTSIHEIASRYFTVRNRITWEREKG